MKNKNIQINTVDDFNCVASEILDDFLLDFHSKQGLTREPTQEDIDLFETDIGWMYTQKGMKLYNSACRHLRRLGEKIFPNEEHNLEIKAMGMLFP